MPEEIPLGFSDEVLEADIRRLAEEVKKTREHPESRNLSEQDILKQSIQAIAPPSNLGSGTVSPRSPLSDDIQNAPAEAKLEIEYLIDTALHQGIEKANTLASQSSPFVLDAFHDLLVGKFYPELQKRGILK